MSTDRDCFEDLALESIDGWVPKPPRTLADILEQICQEEISRRPNEDPQEVRRSIAKIAAEWNTVAEPDL